MADITPQETIGGNKGILSDSKKPTVVTVKPLQAIPYAEKVANDNEWGKQNLEYLLNAANFRITTGTRLNNLQIWYDAYNNRIDESIFNYVTNPLNTDNLLYKSFPAKIRPYNILRPNIDLLIGEWYKRPFKYDVLNLEGEGAYNSFLAEREKVYKKNIEQRFVNGMNQKQETDVPSQKIPDPATVMEHFNANYKDANAIEGYKALKILEMEKKLKERYRDHFKDYLIGGEVASSKRANHGDIDYTKLSVMWVDYDKAPLTKNIEDGDWAVVKYRVTVSDLVDQFYGLLKPEHLHKLEQDDNAYRKRLFFNLTNATSNSDQIKDRLNKVDLYYSCWKSRRLVGFLSYPDPLTGQMQKTTVDEGYKVDKHAGEECEWIWLNEGWEGWRINDDIYLGIQPVALQRNELANFSTCKLPINGRRFSDTESVNVSVMSLGMTYQIMYIIMMYRIELAIARAKNDILLIDKNVIPDDDEGGETKFFYYAEAMGYALIDRNQDGVDKSWNQYQVLKFQTFEYISKLIEIANFYKAAWDELLGITRQRKGMNNASDGLGVSQEAIFRSSIISEIIFSSFDEWVQSELQGLIDLSKYAWADGKKGQFRTDDGKIEMLNLETERFINADLGIFAASMGQNQDKLAIMQQQINAIAQRKDVKLSTIADLVFTDSYAEIKAKLRESEAIEAAQIQASQQAEHERTVELENMKKDYAEFEHMLKLNEMEVEQDRLDNREYIMAQLKATAESVAPPNTSGIEDMAKHRLETLSREAVERERTQAEERQSIRKTKLDEKKIAAQLKIAQMQKKTKVS